MRAARQLFAEHGFAGVGTEAIVAAANVSRGALYHQFADKTELFTEVMVLVEAEATERIAADSLASGQTGFVGLMMAALDSWLDACESTEVQRILLLDGPSVLGWARWRELCQPYVLSLVEGLIAQAIDAGTITALPTRALAHAVVAVGDEAAMYVATADDKAAARRDMAVVLERLLTSLGSAQQ